MTKNLSALVSLDPVSQTAFRKLALCLLCLLVGLSAQAQWVQKANALKKRSEVTSVVYNKKLYTFMGFSDGVLNVESDNEVYDPATNTWTLLAPTPTGKVVTHQGVVLVDNSVWHIGGRVGKNPGPLTNQIWIYNINTNSWSPGPDIMDPANGLPLTWGGGGAVLLGRTLHIFGGFVINACNNDQEKYHLTLDVDQWLTTGVAVWKNERKPLPMKRCHIASTNLGGKIYALGGQFDHDCGEKDNGLAHVYNPITDTWTQLTSLPAPRSHAEGGIFSVDGKIYIVAGQQANSVNTNKVTVFDPAGNNGAGSWSEDPAFDLPFGYEGVSAKVIGNTFIYSHGGINNSANTQNQTYTRTITRNPVNQFGFVAPCFDVNVNAAQTVNRKNLLFTIDNPRTYTLSSDAGWLTITKNGTGTAVPSGVDVEVAVNATGLAPGTYTGNITATGTGAAPNYAPASFCVKLTVAGTGSLSTVRINAGGAATTVNGENWIGCSNSGACNTYVTGGFAYTQQPLPSIFGVTGPTNESIMQSEWTGGQMNEIPAGTVAFSYNIPVVNGNYLVRLHFAELNKNGAGLRKFDVNIEGGAKELTNFDIFAEAGGIHKAIFRDFPVSITDGAVNIDFITQVENAKISAIEILPATTSSTTVRVNAGGSPFSASGNRQFAADTYFSGGNSYAVGAAIDNTTDDALYQSERWGDFSYNMPVASGNYTVILHFAEIYLGVNGTGARKFNVDIEGTRKLTDYDILAKAGCPLKAIQETFTVTVTDGTLNIVFAKGSSDSPKVSAIEVLPSSVSQQTIAGFTLINADTNQPIKELSQGEQLNLASLPTRNLNIRINTSPETVGSVVLNLNCSQYVNTESSGPYALYGNNGNDYNSWTPAAGKYSLTATPYTGAGGQGTAGIPSTISFAVVDQAANARLTAEGKPELGGPLVKYYPNPFTQSFTLQVQGKEKQPLFIYDTQGRVVLRLEEAQPEQTISLGKEFAPGMYYLQVGTGKKAKRYKVIKSL